MTPQGRKTIIAEDLKTEISRLKGRKVPADQKHYLLKEAKSLPPRNWPCAQNSLKKVFLSRKVSGKIHPDFEKISGCSFEIICCSGGECQGLTSHACDSVGYPANIKEGHLFNGLIVLFVQCVVLVHIATKAS